MQTIYVQRFVITVPGIPVAQPRQRHRIVKPKIGREFVQNYTPGKDPVNTYKQAVMIFAKQEFDGRPLDCPVKLQVNAFFPRPKNKIWKTKPMPREPLEKTPDFDNVAKSICDALSGIVWRDDKQVYDARICRILCGGEDDPHTTIIVEPKPDGVDLSDLR